MNDDRSKLMSQLEGLWDNNHRLWEERVNKELLIPLDTKGGITIERDEDFVTILSLGPASKTFRAVQLLCNPRANEGFWADGFVLTRSLFETFVTLEWIALDKKVRFQIFADEYVLKMAHFSRLVDNSHISDAKRLEIHGWHTDVMKRQNCSPKNQKLLPSLESRVKEVAAKLPEEHPHIQYQYEMCYRDVSGFAHSSAWGLLSRLPRGEGPIEAEADPKLGIEALMTNGEWFLRVLRVWNKTTKLLSDHQLTEWQEEWAKIHFKLGL